MKRYLIEVTSTGTDKNPNFTGAVTRSLHGKAEEMIAYEVLNDVNGYGDYIRTFNNTDDREELMTYGYTRKGTAERIAEKVRNEPDTYRHWTHVVKVVEFDI